MIFNLCKEPNNFQFIEQISYHSTHNECCDFLLQTCQQIILLDLPPLQPVPQAAFHISRAVADLISLCTVLPKDLVPFSLKIQNEIVQIIFPYQLIQRFKDFPLFIITFNLITVFLIFFYFQIRRHFF